MDNRVYRFKITLKEISPSIWRRIEIGENASFWDLKSAILDVMGWLDYHLFQFEMKKKNSLLKHIIGAPLNDEEEKEGLLPSWSIKIRDYFDLENNTCDFLYDFGDHWEHTIKLESIHEVAENTTYPICLDGQRACPPEDCGGTSGYDEMLETLQNPDDDEYELLLEWLGGFYDPEYFNKNNVVFEDPKESLNIFFGDEPLPIIDEPKVTVKMNKPKSKKTNANSLKQLLMGYKKQQLIYLAQNHQMSNPSRFKKADLITKLTALIQQKFAEELIYFRYEELMLFSDSPTEMFAGMDINEMIEETKRKTNENFSYEQLLEMFNFIQNNLLDNSPNTVLYLFNKGYAFPRGEYVQEGIVIPEDLKDIYIKRVKQLGKEFIMYQSIQFHTVSMLNLYGVCTYSQLHKIFKKYSPATITLKRIRDYVIKWSEKSELFTVDDNYFYTTDLSEDDFELITQSDLKREYYFPTDEEVTAYSMGLVGPESAETVKAIQRILFNRTRITDTLTGKSYRYEEACDFGKDEIASEYSDIQDRIVISARMGRGLLDLMDILDFSICKFDTLKDIDTFYALYLELLENSRKWPLKGAFYSALKKRKG